MLALNINQSINQPVNCLPLTCRCSNKLPTQHTLDEISALQVNLDIIRLRQIGIGLS